MYFLLLISPFQFSCTVSGPVFPSLQLSRWLFHGGCHFIEKRPLPTLSKPDVKYISCDGNNANRENNKFLTKRKKWPPFTRLSFIHCRIILNTFGRSDSIFRKSEAPSVEGKRRVNSREIVVKFLFWYALLALSLFFI